LRDTPVPPGILDPSPAARASHAFPEYGAALHFRDHATANSYIDPGLRFALGATRLNNAFQAQSAFYRTQAPVIANQTSRGPFTSVHWAINDAQNNPTTHTTTFLRSGDRWLVVFDSFLGDSLALAAQEQAQARIDPTAAGPSPAALAAGERARALQLDYLASLNR